MNYSVIGDTVNVSARLESLMRLYNASSIGSEASMDDAPNLPIASSASSPLLVSRSGFASSNY
jgi:class 3 adenylate cyclase